MSSPLAWLRFSLYDTRSARVKPSWAVTKLTEAVGPRPPFHRRPAFWPHLQAGEGVSVLVGGWVGFVRSQGGLHEHNSSGATR